MQKLSDLIKPKDIIDRVKEPKKPKLSKVKRAEIILDRALKDKTYRQLEKEHNITSRTGLKVIQDNKDLVQQITTDKSSIELERDIKAIDYSFSILLTKLKQLKDNPKKINEVRINELTDTIAKLRNEVRLTKGEATSITKTQKQDPEQLKARILTLAKIVKDNDKTTLAQLVFNNDNNK